MNCYLISLSADDSNQGYEKTCLIVCLGKLKHSHSCMYAVQQGPSYCSAVVVVAFPRSSYQAVMQYSVHVLLPHAQLWVVSRLRKSIRQGVFCCRRWWWHCSLALYPCRWTSTVIWFGNIICLIGHYMSSGLWNVGFIRLKRTMFTAVCKVAAVPLSCCPDLCRHKLASRQHFYFVGES